MSTTQPNQRISKSKRDRLLRRNLNALTKSLTAIDLGEEPSCYADAVSDDATAMRRAVMSALSKIQQFLLSQGINSNALNLLTHNLSAVEYHGNAPAIFKPLRMPGRNSDGIAVQSLKGQFAAMAYEQMYSGMPREQAASWIARKIPPEVARRVSSKPIRTSTIKEWMSQYGCNARIRRELNSAHTPDEFQNIIWEKIQWRNIGQLRFLDVMLIGRAYRVTGETFPFEQALIGLRQQVTSKTGAYRKQ